MNCSGTHIASESADALATFWVAPIFNLWTNSLE